MGFFDSDSSDVDVDYPWHPNDGIVNSISMSGPKVGFNPNRDKPEIIAASSSTTSFKAGVFYSMPILKGWDHLGIVGIGLWQILPFYTGIANRLVSLPTTDGSNPSHRHLEAVVAPPATVEKIPGAVPLQVAGMASSTFCTSLEKQIEDLCNGKHNGFLSTIDCVHLKSEYKSSPWCQIQSQTLVSNSHDNESVTQIARRLR